MLYKFIERRIFVKIEYNNEIIDVVIEYKKRKKIEIRIDSDGTVRALAPKDVEKECIIETIKSKIHLIAEKLNERRKIFENIENKECLNEKKILYLGSNYPYKIIVDENNEKSLIRFENGMFFINVVRFEEDLIKYAMENFYKKECSKVVQQRINYYQKYFKTKPKVIKIVESKNTWGTCNSNRDMNFNWRLIMAPIEIIDYIVVHEMCHMVHMNHSKSFWKFVGKIIPDYKKRTEWLQVNGSRMNII